jgi:hypothetical protein
MEILEIQAGYHQVEQIQSMPRQVADMVAVILEQVELVAQAAAAQIMVQLLAVQHFLLATVTMEELVGQVQAVAVAELVRLELMVQEILEEMVVWG